LNNVESLLPSVYGGGKFYSLATNLYQVHLRKSSSLL
jgi:hypothetical protein